MEAAFDLIPIPSDVTVTASIHCEVPGGCSTGTSAAVTVALLGALDCLTPDRMSQSQLAKSAHRVESELLGQQSGIQDQIASAYGGINFIEMYEYPNANVTQLNVERNFLEELEQRLDLFYVGASHDSSEVHQMVIRG